MPPKKDDKESEEEDIDVQISFKDLEKSMTIFTGDDTYPIETFLEEFEDTAQLMKWTKIEKLIYAKRLLDGTAKLFLRSLGRVKDYVSLKKALQEEFGPKINSAIIHKKLAARKMKNDETYQQYFLTMKELALHGKVEDAALIEYVIDGIRDLETNKTILYGASDIKDFRKKLDIYSDFRKKVQSKPAPTGNSSTHNFNRKMLHAKRCFNCGDLGHESSSCQKGIKCFKCNSFGHKSTECTIISEQKKILNIQNKDEEQKEKNFKIKDERVPYKRIKIKGIDFTTLIDTGSDVNLITKSEFEKIKDTVKNYKGKLICLKGIAESKIVTEGIFTTEVQIDQYYTNVAFHVVKDHDIPVTILIGNPILKDFEVHFTPDGVYVKKTMHLTLLAEDEEPNQDHDISDSKYTEMSALIKKAQNEDNYIKTQKKILEKEPYKDYILHKDILYKEKNGNRLIIVPKKMQFEIIRRNHERRHFGITKTEELISREYYIENLQDKIRKIINNCVECILMSDKENEVLKILEERNIEFFKGNRQELKEKAKESIQKIQEENLRNYNKKRKKTVAYNDLVAITKTQFSQASKLFPKFLGPYEITAKKRNDRYTVKKVGIGEGPINTSTSADLMKPWTMTEDGSSSGTDE